MFGTKMTFSRKENLRAILKRSFKRRLEWNEAIFFRVYFGQRKIAEFSFFFFLVGEKPEHQNLQKWCL